ncbi:vitamin B6 photo-protection and homoeostasis-domain-containing protein [Cercophora scortea]|uniref:Vitamin B6 photo-protection and homoeostasis-domain-containing protein n=1 Tax=Cercophora scortea TaxID=314031 RepID=A0AAE0M343_9PEZI|nr:vitamin B6 photo-protection and homoeostasis-domain-containing protein [Cercophora scortea]
MTKSIYDIDPAGNVICTYTAGGGGHGSPDSEKEPSNLRVEITKVPLAKAIFYAFLPAGFPHSVTDDYLSYQTYDSLQAFASSITSLLANRAVLEGLGVGDASSSPTGALILKITGDTISRVATILFAHRMGQAIEPECKFYRFLADLFNDCAQFLDLLTPALPYLPKLSVIVCAGVLRSLCGVAANASKASLSAHFARTGNLAELNAKEASQETIVSLFGMLVGSLVVRMVEDKAVVWMLMVLLVGVHLLMNYRAVRCVRMRTLNRQRATIVFSEWLRSGTVLGLDQAARRESILLKGRGNIASKSGEYTGVCDFGTYGDVMGWNPRGYQRYDFETPTGFYMRIALKEGVGSAGALGAWFDAVNHAWHFDEGLKDGLQSHYENEMPLGYVEDEQKSAIFKALEAKGWDLEANQLETRSPVRVRVGDGKKAPPVLSEKETAHLLAHQETKHD